MSGRIPDCGFCQHLEEGQCAVFAKSPPAHEFARRCRHYEENMAAELPLLEQELHPDPVADRPCKTWHAHCPRRYEDAHGAWCRIDGDTVTTFRPIRENTPCPALEAFNAMTGEVR